MEVQAIGIIGHGHFGQFVVELCQRFLPAVEVRVYSRRQEPDGELLYSIKDTAACDVVVLCGSISEYEEQLKQVIPLLNSETVVVDVATVKKYPTELFAATLRDRRFVSCHPMFGPQSYKKSREDVSGFRIVVTNHTLAEDEYTTVRNFFSKLGFVVIEMTADEHDQLLAETLFLTHYIGQSLNQAGFGRTTIDTVSFSYLMDAVESVTNDSKLFVDVYRYNPYCKEVIEQFRQAEAAVMIKLSKETKS